MAGFLESLDLQRRGYQPVQQSGINQGNTTGMFGNQPSPFMQNLQVGSQAIGAVSDIFNMWQARQNYKLGKEAFKFNKQLSTTNLNNQANLTNERLATRQTTRNSYIPDSVPVGEFMKTYSVKGIGG